MKKLIILLLASVVISGCSLNPRNQPAQTETPAVEDNQDQAATNNEVGTNPSLEITVTNKEENLTVEEILNETGMAEYVDYGEAGKFVQSLNGVAANNEHYWAFYLNDEYSQAGVSDTIVQEGDVIKFVYEEIDPNQL